MEFTDDAWQRAPTFLYFHYLAKERKITDVNHAIPSIKDGV